MIDKIKDWLGIGPAVDYTQLMKQGAIILDVRTKAEYSGGNIKGSMNISVDALRSNLKRLQDKNKPIITCCATGMRSGSAKSILKSNGFTRVYNGGSWYRLQNKIR